MRLTLRTLLAWLDDTLSPAEVREIGKQVADSPFAKELVERVHRVTRQRRLSVPSRTGPDATDPNVVACYLDNELPADQVADFEKRCLTSDVHLAEVASVHQILSLIGQKAKVPIEARHRMYHLVKGRESVAPRAPRASKASEPEPVSEPVQPWVTPEPPRRPWLERFGPAAAVIALIAVLCWSAWLSLTPPEPSGAGPIALKGPIPEVPKAEALPAAAGVDVSKEKKAQGPGETAPQPATETHKEAAKGAGPGGSGSPERNEAEKPAARTASPAPEKKEEANRPSLAPGVVGLAEKPAGVLLRFNREERQWQQASAETALKDQDRLLNLQPYRSTLVLGDARVDLVGEAEVWVLSAAASQAARINLVQGRVVVHGTTPPAPFIVQFAKRSVEVNPPPGASVGLERINRRESGASLAAEPILRVFAPEGEVTLAADEARETLVGPGAITFDPQRSWTDPEAKPAPSWVTEPKLTPHDAEIGDQFQHYFREGPVMRNLVEAMEDDHRDVRRLAISAIGATGDVAMIVPLLNTQDDAVSRRAAIAVLRAFLAQGPDASKELHTQLVSFFGDELAGTVEKLLVGYTAKESRDDATWNQLVQLLSSPNPNVGIRELALDTLQSLTGRDDLGYDADRPEGKGLKAWKDLLRDHELRPAGAPKPESRPAPAAKKEK